MRRDLLAAFAEQLSPVYVVVVEATGNAAAVSAVIAPHVKRVVIANPKQVRAIALAKIKTDTIDAGVLAQLYASAPTESVAKRRRSLAVSSEAQLP